MKNAKLLILFILFSSCSLFERRQYFAEMEYSDDGISIPGRDFAVIPGDTGHSHRSYENTLKRTPASFEEKQRSIYEYSLDNELAKLEGSQPPQYYTHYLKNQERLTSVSQKIYFLRLPNIRERNAYLEAFGGGEEESSFSLYPRETGYREIASVPSRDELTLGMSMEEVQELFGSPKNRESAYGQGEGTERWTYSNGGSDSYIYFSKGQVQGWYD